MVVENSDGVRSAAVVTAAVAVAAADVAAVAVAGIAAVVDPAVGIGRAVVVDNSD